MRSEFELQEHVLDECIEIDSLHYRQRPELSKNFTSHMHGSEASGLKDAVNRLSSKFTFRTGFPQSGRFVQPSACMHS